VSSNSWFAETTPVAAPARPRTRTRSLSKSKTRSRRRPRSRAAILWIVISAALLAGVVFVNLAVLRLNLELGHATQQVGQLRATNASLQAQLSAALASGRIQQQARRQDGLVPADQSTIGYINLGH